MALLNKCILCNVKCNSVDRVKRGIFNDKQRYMFKGYGYHYTVGRKSTAQTSSAERQALQLHLEGLRSIGRILKVSHVIVYNWIKYFGGQIDEIHSYISDKKTTVIACC